MANKQSSTIQKKKLGPQLGFRTSDFFKGSRFSGNSRLQNINKNPQVSFHTQHRGGSWL